MAIKPFRKVRCKDADLRSVQDAVEVTLRDISSRRFVDGQAITGVSLLAAQDNTIPHGLGRQLIGWVITAINANAIVWDKQSTNQLAALNLVLACSADCTVDIWVF